MLTYKCEICGSIGGDEERLFHTPVCCGQEKGMTIIPSSFPSIHVMPSYQSPITGKWIDSPRQRREDMAANNCVEYEPSMADDNKKRHAAEDMALDKKVDEIVEQEIYSMPTVKREKLVSELESGVDVEVSRI